MHSTVAGPPKTIDLLIYDCSRMLYKAIISLGEKYFVLWTCHGSQRVHLTIIFYTKILPLFEMKLQIVLKFVDIVIAMH